MVHCLQYINNFIFMFIWKRVPESCFTNKFVVVQMKLNLHFLRINTDQEEQPWEKNQRWLTTVSTLLHFGSMHLPISHRTKSESNENCYHSNSVSDSSTLAWGFALRHVGQRMFVVRLIWPFIRISKKISINTWITNFNSQDYCFQCIFAKFLLFLPSFA